MRPTCVQSASSVLLAVWRNEQPMRGNAAGSVSSVPATVSFRQAASSALRRGVGRTVKAEEKQLTTGRPSMPQ